MAEAGVGAIIQVLVEKLLTLSQEQISLVRHFKDDLETLQKSFSMVQDVLHDAEKKKVTEKKVKSWLRDLEDLAFDADNVIDEIDYKLLSKKVKRSLNKKVQSLLSSPISYRQKMGSRIKDISERLEKINQLGTAFGLQKSLARATDRLDAYEHMESNAFAKDPIFLGRENELSEIVKMLITSTGPAGAIIPIVGMGGQGKTAIAREVYHDENIKSHFGDNRVWVYVSSNFDVLTILKKVLASITTQKSELETQQDVLKQLQEHLGAKKYLLVLDDVWNDNREVWDGFVNSLAGISTANGYCMIVTTRSEDVASIVKKTLPVHKLKGLPEDDCWSIIKANAFGGGNVSVDFEEIGKNIAKKCQGLPLAAKVVGGLLSSMKSKDEWKSIEENWLSDVENPISNVLKLSFDHLPSPSLKKCFAYCSIFPKGYEIKKERLVELWMAEGFLQTNITSMEATGSKNFNFLLRNSLLQYARSDNNGNAIHCSMHDLVHDLAYSVLCENDDVMEGACKGRYIGYKPSGHGLSSITTGQEKYVRTLFFDGKVSDIKFFEDFESLHTLTLVGFDIDDLPTSIKKLKHLRYLDISETRIRCLPESIGELYHLQTFRGSYLKRLPDSLSNLISLRHLHLLSRMSLPPGIGKLTSLQTFPYFCVGDKKGCGIPELGHLKNIKGELEIKNLEKVRNKNEASSAGLIQKSGIYKIKLLWSFNRQGDGANDESVLEGLQPHPSLKSLEILGYNGKHLPPWASKMAVQVDDHSWKGLDNLVEIRLQHCRECEELPMLGHLPHLRSLSLNDLINVKSIGSSFYGIDNLSYNGVCTNNVVVFPSLRELLIIGCRSLRELPDDLHSLNSLERLYIRGCPELKSIPPCPSSRGHESQQQQQQQQHDCFTSLRELSIIDCKGLTNLSGVIGCVHKMSHLRSLIFKRVPKFSITYGGTDLEMSPLLFDSDSSLSNVSFNETFDTMFSQISITLRRLHLEGMGHWECLPDGIQHLTSLQELRLTSFGIEALPEWFGNLSSLEKLSLFNCKRLRHFPSKQAMQCGLSKLTRLFIFDSSLLEERSNNNVNNSEGPKIADSEWSKISHIPTIYVNTMSGPYRHHGH